MLEGPDRSFRAAAEDAVNGWDFGDCRVVLCNAIQFRLNDHHIWTGAAPAKGCAGIGIGIAPDGRIVYDLHISVIASQNLHIG